MKTHIINLITSVFLLLMTFFTASGAVFYDSYTLTTSDGLSGSNPTCSFRDSEGLLWIGTWTGMNVFDGSTVWQFGKEINGAGTLSTGLVYDIAEQRPGIIWATMDACMVRIDKETAEARYYTLPSSVASTEVSVSPEGRVFCFSEHWGIAYYDEALDRVVPINIPGVDASSIISMTCYGPDKIFIGFQFGPVQRFSYSFSQDGTLIPSPPETVITDAGHFFRDGNLLHVSGAEKLVLYDIDNDRVLSTVPKPDASMVYRMISFGKDSALVATTDMRVYLVDYNTGSISPWEPLDGDNVKYFHRDSQGILWVAVDGLGMKALYPRTLPVGRFLTSSLFGKRASQIRCFLENPDGTILAATQGNGILKLKEDKVLRNWTLSDGLGSMTVNCLSPAPGGGVFVSGETGISFFDPVSGRISPMDFPDGGFPGIVYSLLYDSENSCLWAGTFGNGLYRLDVSSTGRIPSFTGYKTYTYGGSGNGTIGGNIVMCIIKDGKDALWVGTLGGGVDRLDIPGENWTKVFFSDEEYPQPSNNVLCLRCFDGADLWVCTAGGLFRIPLAGNALPRMYTDADGLNGSTVHAIEQDRSGNLWLSTNRGICRFDPDGSGFTFFSGANILQNLEFTNSSSLLDSEGRIWFGGISGYNYFNPSGMELRSDDPGLRFNGFAVKGVPKSDFRSGVPVILRSDENFFTISYSSLDMIGNESCEYSYMLDGFDETWSLPSTMRMANYTNVPPGKYRFLLRHTNGDGVWSPSEASVSILVKRPWWTSWWARAAYIMVVLSAIAVYWLLRRKWTLREGALEQERLDRERQRQTYEAKLDFFTSITKDFATPLTLIGGSIEELSAGRHLSPAENRYSLIIRESVEKMQGMIRGITDFRKMESGTFTPLMAATNVKDVASKVLKRISREAERYPGVTLVQQIPDKEISAVTDSGAFERIVTYLVGFAIASAQPKGEVTASLAKGAGEFTFSVRCPGNGISEESFKEYFDRYKILEDIEKQGSLNDVSISGTALAMAKELTEALSGRVGTEFGKDGFITISATIPEGSADLLPASEDGGKAQAGAVRPGYSGALDQGIRPDVLTVDDDQDIRDFVVDVLGTDYQVICAGSGDEALEVLRHVRPNVIITDLNMPGTDGFELIRRLKENDLTRNIPVIVLTFMNDVESEIRANSLGIDAFIPKPFNPRHLRSVIKRVLNSRQTLRSYYSSVVSRQDMVNSNVVDIDDKDLLLNLTALVEQNLTNEQLSPAFLCERLFMSRAKLYRKIRELSGKSPAEFIRSVKLEKAGMLLKTTRLTVSEIQYRTGFNNKAYFFREFASYYHKSPKEYRLSPQDSSLEGPVQSSSTPPEEKS